MYSLNLFQKSERQKVFTSLVRKIIKESNTKIKPFDNLVHDYLIMEIRSRFEKFKNIINLEQINSKFHMTEKIIEDLQKIEIVAEDGSYKDTTITKCNYIVNTIVYSYNLEYLIKHTYGKIGDRRNLFLIAHHYQVRDLMTIKYRQNKKLEFEDYTQVPLPECFYNHIIDNQFTNPRVINSEYLLSVYKEILF